MRCGIDRRFGPAPLGRDLELSKTVLDRNGHAASVLRHEPRAAGACRPRASKSIRAFSTLLFAYEDKRFFQHHGVDPLALRPRRAAIRHAMDASSRAARPSPCRSPACSNRAQQRSLDAKLRQTVRAHSSSSATLSKDEILGALSHASRLMAAISKASGPPRSLISARSHAGSRSAKRRCSWRCRNRRSSAGLIASTRGRSARATGCSTASARQRHVRRGGDRARQAGAGAARAQDDADDRAARRRRRRRPARRTRARSASPSTRGCRRLWKSSRSSARAR